MGEDPAHRNVGQGEDLLHLLYLAGEKSEASEAGIHREVDPGAAEGVDRLRLGQGSHGEDHIPPHQLGQRLFPMHAAEEQCFHTHIPEPEGLFFGAAGEELRPFFPEQLRHFLHTETAGVVLHHRDHHALRRKAAVIPGHRLCVNRQFRQYRSAPLVPADRAAPPTGGAAAAGDPRGVPLRFAVSSLTGRGNTSVSDFHQSCIFFNLPGDNPG